MLGLLEVQVNPASPSVPNTVQYYSMSGCETGVISSTGGISETSKRRRYCVELLSAFFYNPMDMD